MLFLIFITAHLSIVGLHCDSEPHALPAPTQALTHPTHHTGAASLVHLLSENTALRFLSLSAIRGVGDETAAELARALSTSCPCRLNSVDLAVRRGKLREASEGCVQWEACLGSMLGKHAMES